MGDFRYLEVLEGFPNYSTKNLNKEPSSLALFTAPDPTEYWGMIREWVYLFLQTVKIKTTKKRNMPECLLSERATLMEKQTVARSGFSPFVA